jgi:hypothetical protein
MTTLALQQLHIRVKVLGAITECLLAQRRMCWLRNHQEVQ